MAPSEEVREHVAAVLAGDGWVIDGNWGGTLGTTVLDEADEVVWLDLPFGGTKDTGNGHREAGQAALDVFTEWKSIYVDYSGKLQRAQIDNVQPG